MNCPNCKSAHNCSCKIRVASDCKKVCTNCIVSYEASLNKGGTPIKKPKNEHIAPVINSITYKQSR
jgi:hypothetical protein